METTKPLKDFFQAIEKDYRISSTHIGIFAALLYYRSCNGFVNPIEAFRLQIMTLAKISAPETYRKCMKELTDYGYLKYIPSFKKNQPSKIYFNDT